MKHIDWVEAFSISGQQCTNQYIGGSLKVDIPKKIEKPMSIGGIGDQT